MIHKHIIVENKFDVAVMNDRKLEKGVVRFTISGLRGKRQKHLSIWFTTEFVDKLSKEPKSAKAFWVWMKKIVAEYNF